jgi:hypothetical protein
VDPRYLSPLAAVPAEEASPCPLCPLFSTRNQCLNSNPPTWQLSPVRMLLSPQGLRNFSWIGRCRRFATHTVAMSLCFLLALLIVFAVVCWYYDSYCLFHTIGAVSATCLLVPSISFKIVFESTLAATPKMILMTYITTHNTKQLNNISECTHRKHVSCNDDASINIHKHTQTTITIRNDLI